MGKEQCQEGSQWHSSGPLFLPWTCGGPRTERDSKCTNKTFLQMHNSFFTPALWHTLSCLTTQFSLPFRHLYNQPPLLTCPGWRRAKIKWTSPFLPLKPPTKLRLKQNLRIPTWICVAQYVLLLAAARKRRDQGRGAKSLNKYFSGSTDKQMTAYEVL